MHLSRVPALLVFGLAAVHVAGAIAGDEQRPRNFVFFLIDDLGWTDVGCYGGQYYETPNIDRLAGQGMRFTDAYAACCVCSPTRASILTGKYPARLHVTHAIPIEGWRRLKEPPPLLPPTYVKNLPLDEVTIAEALKPAGYATGTFGKWHVCWDKAFYPENQGFDVNVGGNNMGNPGNYFHPYDGKWRMTRNHPWVRWHTVEGGAPGEYLTDRLTDEAVRFIEQNRNQPFFLYLPHYAVHTPIQAKKEIIAKYEAKPKDQHHNNVKYAAMIDSVDQSVGRVLKKLEELGIAGHTVVIFTSDNGGHGRITSHHPLRGNKGNFYEGGIRVPLVVKWPGVVESGSVCSAPVTSTDFYPTILQIAGLPLRSEQHMDGASLMPLLRQSGSLKRDSLYWHFPHYIGAGHPDPATPVSVIRQGNWKLLENLEEDRLELYNLKKDIGETKNLAGEMPEKAMALQLALARWRVSAGAQMPTPNPSYQPAVDGSN